MAIGSLPLTGAIQFDFLEQELLRLEKGDQKKFITKAILFFPDNPSETKKEIHLIISSVASPYQSITRVGENKATVEIFGNTESQNHASERAAKIFISFVFRKKMWTLSGVLNGKKQIPISIVYLPELGMGIYSFVKEEGEKEVIKL